MSAAGPLLVTGATGFVGRALLERASHRGLAVRGAARRAPRADAGGHAVVAGPSLGADADWRPLLHGVRAVIHCAARVHVMHDTAPDPLAEFRRVNVDGTLNLARQAADAGVRRFVFVSSIKVNGERTARGDPFRADAPPGPRDPYGVSKAEAEDALMALAARSALEVVVVRPPLVYGPGVKANFQRLMAWLHRGVPLPFGALDNRRSLVALDNLTDLLLTCVEHPGAAGGRFLVSDGEDLSTTQLLRRTGAALGRPARLLPVPAAWLRGAAALARRPELAQRLCDSLEVDIGPTRARLGWTPPVDVDSALRAAARAFLEGAGHA